MSRLQLSFACGLYDRMLALYTGEVKPAGIDLNFIAIDQPRPIFDRMSGGEEFDVAEYSSSEFVQRFANRECPFVAIPVFPSIAFRMGFIAINRKSGIKNPKDLAGKRIGTTDYKVHLDGYDQLDMLTRPDGKSRRREFFFFAETEPTAIRVAVDALAVYVNKDNPLEQLTLQQVDAIFSKGRACGGTSETAVIHNRETTTVTSPASPMCAHRVRSFVTGAASR